MQLAPILLALAAPDCESLQKLRPLIKLLGEGDAVTRLEELINEASTYRAVLSLFAHSGGSSGSNAAASGSNAAASSGNGEPARAERGAPRSPTQNGGQSPLSQIFSVANKDILSRLGEALANG